MFKASTVIFPNVAAMRSREWKDKSGYTYGLHGTPTTFILEERLCALEGGLQCVLVPSGLAAIGNVSLALLKAGDEVLMPDNAYGPNKSMSEATLAQFGIRNVLYDALDPADLAARITPATRLVWLEAPGSVTLEFPDLCELVRICRARGVTTALDNTWGAGLAFAPFDLTGDGSLGVDVSVHALTKYPSGGGDVLMGSVITRERRAAHEDQAAAHAPGTGRGRQRRRSGAARPAQHRPALPRPRPGRARAWRSGCSSRPRWRRCCTRRCPARPAMPTGGHCVARPMTGRARRRGCSAS